MTSLIKPLSVFFISVFIVQAENNIYIIIETKNKKQNKKKESYLFFPF